MPLSDIATAHSSFQKHLGYTRVQLFINGNIPNYSLLRHEERWSSFQKSLHCTGKLNFGLVHYKRSCPGFLVSAVATLEPKCLVQNKDREQESYALSSTAESDSKTVGIESLTEDSEEVDERETLRRLRISEGNKGNKPWNKGRKHSPETRQRIRERTRLAMQRPQVKMKLVKSGYAQSAETRAKIAAGLRMCWQKRRKKLMLQETCFYNWQNLIAEAARRGFEDEEELQWDSYNILSNQLQQEWLDSIEQRKSVPRAKACKRAPKSLEQRRKIAAAIVAKWADPEYRTRVRSGLAKYHGIPKDAERKVKKKPSGEGSTYASRKKSNMERSTANNVNDWTQLPKLKKRNVPKYKDPLAKTKLEMLKSIRAQRMSSVTKKTEALERAKLLIAEAQKAAKALEVAAMRSPVARASLIEAQKLIAEATQSIESIENREPSSQDDARSGHYDYVEKGGETLEETMTAKVDLGYHKIVNGVGKIITREVDQRHHKWVNGVKTLQPGEGPKLDSDLYKLTILDEVEQKPHQLSPENFAENQDMKECMEKQYTDPNGSLRSNGISPVNGVKLESHEEDALAAAKTTTKKWVRGRLVEVGEGM